MKLKYYKLFTFIFVFLTIGANAQIISTVAGNGTTGSTGDGGPATGAEMRYPTSVAVNAAGDLFIADPPADRVRMVNTSGIITAFAGNGTVGSTGDYSPATAATLNLGTYADGTTGLAVDASGNVFIADAWNNVIRKVDPSGIIITVAGNGTAGFGGDGMAATVAMLDTPGGVAVDAAGNLYIADVNNNRIRMVNTSGIISTVAGNGTHGFSGDGAAATAAMLYFPRGVTTDASGNLYIADWGNFRIRKISAGGIITTVAGNGTTSYMGDGGQATAAGIGSYGGIALDGAGNLYISGGAVVRKVNSSGVINTIVGNGTFAFGGDGGPATAAQLSEVWGAAFNKSGDLFITDAANYRIREVKGVGIGPLSIMQTASANPNISLFPNPNTGSFTVTGSLNSATAQNVSFEITDMLGQAIYKHTVASQKGSINTQVELNGITNGMYLLHITGEGENSVMRFVVER